MSYCNLFLLHPLASCCCFPSYSNKNIKLCILLKHVGFDNLTEANSYWWQAWSSVRLAEDCYMFINRFTQMLILLFNRTIYLNLGWLPCLLQQMLIKVRCLSLVWELFLSGQKEQFGIGKELHVLRSSWGRPSSVWKRDCYLHFIGGVCARNRCLHGVLQQWAVNYPFILASAPTSFTED